MENKLKLTAWKPIQNMKDEYYIYTICDNLDGLKIILNEYNNPKNQLHMIFTYGAAAYRITEELLTINLLQIKDGNNGNDQKIDHKYREEWFLFKAINSDYLEWASKMSNGISDDLNLIHFVIFTKDRVLEILNQADPKVEIVKIK
jgi:hypothetical protein